MRVFSGSLQEFQYKLQANTLFLDMQERFPQVVGRTPSPSEAASWRGSLPRLDYTLREAGVPSDVYMAIEERIPYFGKRMDACLFGHTKDGNPYSVIVELKGWGEAEATDDGNVRTVIGGAMQIEPHPSAQVRGYHEHLEDFRRAYQGDRRLGLGSAPTVTTIQVLSLTRGCSTRSSTTCARRAQPSVNATLSCWPATCGRLPGPRPRPCVLDAYDGQGLGPRQAAD